MEGELACGRSAPQPLCAVWLCFWTTRKRWAGMPGSARPRHSAYNHLSPDTVRLRRFPVDQEVLRVVRIGERERHLRESMRRREPLALAPQSSAPRTSRRPRFWFLVQRPGAETAHQQTQGGAGTGT